MRILLSVLALIWLAIAPAWADEDDATRAARWEELRHTMFGDRPVEGGSALITLDAPPRALDAALVPITVKLAPDAKIKTLYLLIDGNPSPLAGTFHFGPAADPRELKTRVRVDAYTLLHAVAETEDGKLYATDKYVKAAGGCSAPSSKDAQQALERLGQMKLKAVADAEPGRSMAQLLVSHPNYNGMQMDQVTRNYTPARFVQDIKVSEKGVLIFDLESDISLSEDPAITFGYVPQGTAPLDVEVRDSTNAVFKRSFDQPGKGA
ncbi:MAG TPA: quinoprotein dehydrogenase-associated SoxYZ-like carrier [Aliidongia sp.]|nr:quinoprotein dehydrogenase-associated SoxYZ-like carrier [Aliidongia sp.]